MSGLRTRTRAREAKSLANGAHPGDLLAVEDLRVHFDQGDRIIRAVDGVTYRLAPGRTLAIIGESGSGKTVSARALLGLLPPTAKVTGSVVFEGRELVGISARRLRAIRGAGIAMVFQDPTRSLDPTMKIGIQITEAIRAHTRVSRREAKERAIELLQKVRLPAAPQRFHEYPHQLSGGMRQRAMIAIALSSNPRLLIADEATTALDVTTQAQIMELLRELQSEMHMAMIMISHDLGLAANFADEVAVMYAGRIVEQAETSALFDDVRMWYTASLFAAIPHLGRPSHSLLPVVQGRPPDLSALPQACAFSARCTHARERCRSEVPSLEEHEPGHRYACFFPVGQA